MGYFKATKATCAAVTAGRGAAVTADRGAAVTYYKSGAVTGASGVYERPPKPARRPPPKVPLNKAQARALKESKEAACVAKQRARVWDAALAAPDTPADIRRCESLVKVRGCVCVGKRCVLYVCV